MASERSLMCYASKRRFTSVISSLATSCGDFLTQRQVQFGFHSTRSSQLAPAHNQPQQTHARCLLGSNALYTSDDPQTVPESTQPTSVMSYWPIFPRSSKSMPQPDANHRHSASVVSTVMPDLRLKRPRAAFQTRYMSIGLLSF
jgi:hypothetical protein